jgi:3-oxoadipate enol-lactonase
MPKIEINGVSIHYRICGHGQETIIFAHGLLWSGWIFEDQIAAMQHRYRCITFDFRGQGQSAVTRSGYDMETLFDDTVGLIEALDAARCHFVGLSMGGMIGLRIAVRRPELLKSLALFATSADDETEENKKRYRGLTLVARWLGLRIVANRVMPVVFGKTFERHNSRRVEKAMAAKFYSQSQARSRSCCDRGHQQRTYPRPNKQNHRADFNSNR